MDLGLKNKIAMVAGASCGLGYAVAQALAREGACVCMASSNPDSIRSAAKRLEVETGSPVIGVPANVRSYEALVAWYDVTVQRFGGVDLLYANSGGPPPGATLTFDDGAWQAAFELLVLSVVRLVRLIAPSMEGRGGGSILLSTSSSVKEPIANLALSNALRPAVTGIAKTLAAELGPRAIRVNTILPGRIATDRLRQFTRFTAERAGISPAEADERMTSEVPLRRYGTPEEFGRVAAFLLSDAASYLNGISLLVDGGLTRSMV